MPEEIHGDELSEGYGLPGQIPYVPYTSPQQHPGFLPSTGPGEPNSLPPAPPVLSSAPSMPTYSGGSYVQKKSRKGRWLTISIIVALLLASVASFFVIRYVNRPTPIKALDVFCNALQQEDYRTAYDQFSKKLQHTVSEAAFAAALSQDKVTACTHGTPDDSGNSATTNLKLVHASKGINNDVVTLTRDNNNDWKIDDVYRQA